MYILWPIDPLNLPLELRHQKVFSNRNKRKHALVAWSRGNVSACGVLGRDIESRRGIGCSLNKQAPPLFCMCTWIEIHKYNFVATWKRVAKWEANYVYNTDWLLLEKTWKFCMSCSMCMYVNSLVLVRCVKHNLIDLMTRSQMLATKTHVSTSTYIHRCEDVSSTCLHMYCWPKLKPT
jgi:hypothetical protein